tara:strand:- start:93 stop:638 length:546 start_codon:yes stop_codon:yes gene_type:complete
MAIKKKKKKELKGMPVGSIQSRMPSKTSKVKAGKKATVKKKRSLISKLGGALNPFDAPSKARRKKIGSKIKSMIPRSTSMRMPGNKKRAAAIGAKPKTKVRKNAVSKVSTKKGGDFVKYKKDSKAAGSFRKTFKSKCSGGAKSFSWDGRSYSCAKAGPKKAKKAKKPIMKGGTKGSAEYGS